MTRDQALPRPEMNERSSHSPASANQEWWRQPSVMLGAAMILFFVGTMLLMMWMVYSRDNEKTQETGIATQSDKTSELPTGETKVDLEIHLANTSHPSEKTIEVAVRKAETDEKPITIEDRRKLFLRPGNYIFLVTSDGYEPFEKRVRIEDQAEQVIPVTLIPETQTAAKLPSEQNPVTTLTPPEPPPTLTVNSDPPGAAILLDGWATGFFTSRNNPAKLPLALKLPGNPKPVPVDPEKISVSQYGYDVIEKRTLSANELYFILKKTPPEPKPNRSPKPPQATLPNAETYGIEMDSAAKKRDIQTDLGKMLNELWNADSGQTALKNAKAYITGNQWAKDVSPDPRRSHSHALLQWHHKRAGDAKQTLMDTVDTEANRIGQKVPYFPATRDLIYLKSVTDEAPSAANDLLDLATQTADALKEHPQDARYEAIRNAEFAGQVLAYLQHAKRAETERQVNIRRLADDITQTLPDQALRDAFQSAREDTTTRYNKEVADKAALDKERADYEKQLQESGRLGRTTIDILERRISGRHARAAYASQQPAPFGLNRPLALSAYRGLGGYFFGPVGYHSPSVLFTSGPAINRTYFNNRTTNTIRKKHKEVFEELPKIFRRRPQALNTYVPEELDYKRRTVLRSASVTPEN